MRQKANLLDRSSSKANRAALAVQLKGGGAGCSRGAGGRAKNWRHREFFPGGVQAAVILGGVLAVSIL